MKPFGSSLFYRLYFRLWLAVVVAVLLAVTSVTMAWHFSTERQTMAQMRTVELRNASGVVVGTASASPAGMPGPATTFTVTLNQNVVAGEPLAFDLPKPVRRPRLENEERRGQRDAMVPMGPSVSGILPHWLTPPFGFVWWMMLSGFAVALAAFPVIRRLTARLETLENGVQRWGRGELSLRLPAHGHDEVAALARRFNAAAEQIEQLLSAHKTLLANASHELRSPLARIRMGLALMEGDVTSEARGKLSDEINRSIDELDQLVGEILLSSRLDAAADMGALEMVDLTGLLTEEAEKINAQLNAQAVQVVGSAKLIRRLVRNLLDNAAKYAKAIAPIQIGLIQVVQAGHPVAILWVDDHGPGVPADQRERIFEPFYRMRGASEKQGGVGLGLALVKSIAQRHGGVVRCEERPGGGARFVVELPALSLHDS